MSFATSANRDQGIFDAEGKKATRILEWSDKELWNKKVPLVKILWKRSQIEEETWEKESEIKRKYPELCTLIGMNFNFEEETLYEGRM